MAIYQQFAPPASLSKYIRFFWVFEMDGISGALPYIYRSMADSCGEMIFHYKGVFRKLTEEGSDTEPFSMVHGQCRHFQRYETGDDFGIFGVYFYPFAARQLLGMPATELTNNKPDLQTVFGTGGRILEERMMLAKDNMQRYNILSAFLERQLFKNDKISLSHVAHAVLDVIHSDNAMDVNRLASAYCLSTRQFERHFKDLSGFSPKLYNRITRFSKAMNQYGLQGQSLTDIAYHCGYYDQSHFIHDFKEFSGYHPGAYFSGQAEGIEYRDA